MKIEVERDALHAALRQVVGVVQSRVTIPILANLLLVAEKGELRITGTDLDLQATARLPAAGELRITVDAGKLDSAVRSFKTGKLTLGVEKPGVMLIKQGRGQRSLSTLPAEDFPLRGELTEGVTFRMPGSVLARLFDSAACAMSSEETRYYLCGIFLHVVDDKLLAAATDGHRMVRVETAMPEGAAELPDTIVPSGTVNHVRKLLGQVEAEVTLRVTPRAISFELGSTEIVSKAVEGTFPDYQRIVPAETGRKIELARVALLEPVQCVAAVLNAEGDKVKVRSVAFDLKEGEGGCVVTGRDNAGTSAEEPLDCEFTGEPVRFGMNERYVRSVGEIFAESGKLTLWVNAADAPVRITSEKDPDLLALIMPMRA